ncbi:MAG: S4 domain-containing protein, partial [Candidatus Cloacimonadota bacterium]|nr:S4 domain-containing protein [Candidatus Cloacimonadota bacterium]
MRINKFLAKCNLGSRRDVEDLVLQGKIKVNNRVIKDLS